MILAKFSITFFALFALLALGDINREKDEQWVRSYYQVPPEKSAEPFLIETVSFFLDELVKDPARKATINICLEDAFHWLGHLVEGRSGGLLSTSV